MTSVRCVECGRYHCAACNEAYAPNTHHVDWIGYEPDGPEEHMVVKHRGADFQTAERFRMCEWEPAGD